MNIAILGYGKMGKIIEQIAIDRGHQAPLKITSKNLADLNSNNLKDIDVAIDFSIPEAGYNNVKVCLESGTNIVSGTTGWTAQLPEMKNLAVEKGVGLIYASNFSLGVNLFFAVNEYLAQIMSSHLGQYRPSIEEIHHTSKKDAPSGTGITIAEGILNNTSLEHWINEASDQNNILSLISKRIDPAPGTHIVSYTSAIDTIKIEHEAHSREGFAYGAVLAAEYLRGKSGVHTMREVLGLGDVK